MKSNKLLIPSLKAIAEANNLPIELVSTFLKEAIKASYECAFNDKSLKFEVEIDDKGNYQVWHDKSNITNNVTINLESITTYKNVFINKIKTAVNENIKNKILEGDPLVKVKVINLDTLKVYLYLIKYDIDGYIFISDMLPNDRFNIGDSFYAAIKSCFFSKKGQLNVSLTRRSNNLVVGLLTKEILEIKNGQLKIKALERHCGHFTRVVIDNPNNLVNPIGCCIGFKGYKAAKIQDMLSGEKIDFIVWDNDLTSFLQNFYHQLTILAIQNNHILVNFNDQGKFIGYQGINIKILNQVLSSNITIIGVDKTTIKNDLPSEYNSWSFDEIFTNDYVVSLIVDQYYKKLKSDKDIIDSTIYDNKSKKEDNILT